MQIKYALLRLDADSLSECSLSLTSDHFSNSMLDIITSEKPLCENMDDINYFASKFREIGTQDESYFEKLMAFVKPNNKKDLKALLDSMYEFELFPHIDTAEEYGKYIICDSGHFEYDENLEEYIDFKGYGQQKSANENGAFTEKGYILYHGYNAELAQVLSEQLGIEIPKQDSQELKLYMPLRATTYDIHPFNIAETAISLRKIHLDPLQQSKCKNALIFIDACAKIFDNKNERSHITNINEEEFKIISSKFDSYSIFLSCNPGQSSYSCDELKNGIWTYFLTKAITESADEVILNHQYITDRKMGDYLSLKVSKYAKSKYNWNQNPKTILDSSYENVITEIN